MGKSIRDEKAEYSNSDGLTAADYQELKAIFSRSSRSYHIDVERLLGFYEAAFIAQLRYFLQNSSRVRVIRDDQGRRWRGYWESYEGWKLHLPTMSTSRLQRLVTRLEKLDILYSKRGPNQKWYGLNLKALLSLLQNSDSKELLG